MSVREILRMMLVLTVVTAVCGGGLSLVKMATEGQIQYQKLKNVKEPALKQVLSGYTNDPLTDRKEIVVGEDERGTPIKRPVFYAKKDGTLISVALEAYGGGYDGDIGVMVAFDPDEDTLEGVAVTTHTETPGIGSKVKEDPGFAKQFEGKSIDQSFAPGSGTVDAISGATFSSHGVMKAVDKAIEIYKANKSKILG
ncbi:RnfABCDGE type electron transport complex subunit G [Desulfohalobium retbaense]|uniref:Ion-translocating oxidoreductase complex subunit G n=1 Tax=Desulfohalobium retbaense (strain ATCC 49708 / DSM 5692 / JCM 16813 / HR100) TaxID=485915 RepID=C8WYR1_DESRD|nr:RnfABCDGE type electron transport complex subunit G [Desulfohalobium retbaense]ACV67827.1 electron transport complex, RnfABCDGE type, G subunit [Desulfohalobium retbaense DSM 5692]